MARIRTVKPEFFRHHKLFTAEKETGLPLRVAFAGLWCCADREGRFKWEPPELGIQCLPYDGVDFERVLDALATRGFLVRYAHQDREYGFIPGFTKHQVINNRESESSLPDPNDCNASDASPTREPRVDHASKAEGKGKERKGKERVRADALAKPDYLQADVWDDFNAFRKQTKFPLTPSAWKSIDRELRAGMDKLHDPNVMLAEAMAAGWRGFRLDWYENRIRTNAPRGGLGNLE